MNLFDILPLLRGWSYKTTQSEWKPFDRGAAPQIIFAISEPLENGWLMSVDVSALDCMVKMDLDTPGMHMIGTIDEMMQSGLFMPPPEGPFIALYSRPNPASTAGFYSIHPINSAYPIPYNTYVVIKLSLTNDSTQTSTKVKYNIYRIIIDDKQDFYASLREFNQKSGLGVK